ncbi:MAG: alpha/beta hydrolase [Hyphomonas sp.]|nr:alpha/beta hydrolase [Hyphomonas sp.]
MPPWISRLALPLFLLVACTTPPQAGTAVPQAYSLPRTEVLPLTAASNGVDYQLYVRLPPGYDPANGPYPLLVTLDADYQFALASAHAEHLGGRGQAPELIIVSVAYAGDPDDGFAYRTNRTRDYTPANTTEGGYGPDIQALSGGGPAFADFIRNEALPYLEQRFAIDPQDRVFVGHSYGGLFGTWLLSAQPDLFHRYIFVSPSLWFKDRMMLDDAQLPGPMPRKTYVYLAVGDWENQPDTGHAMVDDLKAYADRLAARDDANLIVKMRVFEDETHASIFPAAFSTGLRHLYLSMDDAP